MKLYKNPKNNFCLGASKCFEPALLLAETNGTTFFHILVVTPKYSIIVMCFHIDRGRSWCVAFQRSKIIRSICNVPCVEWTKHISFWLKWVVLNISRINLGMRSPPLKFTIMIVHKQILFTTFSSKNGS